ncbi:hypothetical protein EZ456_04795 [Pedobacter psychrodurus]|uniref:Aspartyl protease n=1 Tax=Pedobacter psychrodurus TaxID=2530456 RepID=A0A4R0Q2X0_9SPHI|nr:hypothetical protein [Pedobacter psychrodurus]TCD28703.1 hypothetical protein EZ456_04795 [Pedobacter psychrodurus]
MSKTILTAVSLLMWTISWGQNNETSEPQNDFKLVGDVISFPLTIVNAFPFISGEINGVKGKFMFDTGNQDALEINNNIIPLLSQQEKGNGQVGSGQKFKTYINDNIEDVKLINGLHFRNLKQIPSGNYDFLQNDITPDCIGYIGHDFFNGYLFKLDYTKRKLTFYKNSPKRESSKDFLVGEKVVAILNFEIRNLPNHPTIRVKVKDVEIQAFFDTGSYGSLELTDKDSKKLKKQKYLINYGQDGYSEELLVLNNVRINAQLTANFIGIYEHGDSKYLRKALGITEDNYLSIAYRFLANYKTVWDYRHKKIYVLEY